MAFAIRRGVFPTMITPFREDGGIDFGAVERLVDFYARGGCAGVFAVCQSSEMFYLSLAEKTDLLRAVKNASGGRLQIVASGHTSDDPRDQLKELSAMAENGADAVVLVSNRLAAENESDDLLVERARAIFDALPGVSFGIYECPHPYKRLLTEKAMRFLAESGRAVFLKDTSCDTASIERKLDWVKGQNLCLYNANTATLLPTLRAGAAGYSGVMGNFHPDLYVRLIEMADEGDPRADDLQAALTCLSWAENRLYPVCAKYHARLMGLPCSLVTRSQDAGKWNETLASETRQLFRLEEMLRDAFR